MNAYERFYTENKDSLYAFLLRLTGDGNMAADLVQESFARYLSRYGSQDNHTGLLFTIAKNAAFDALRKTPPEPLEDQNLVCPVGDPERQFIQKEAHQTVLAAIQRLNPVERELIALLATERFSYREIGQMLQLSETNVKVRVHRARRKLKEILNPPH